MIPQEKIRQVAQEIMGNARQMLMDTGSVEMVAFVLVENLAGEHGVDAIVVPQFIGDKEIYGALIRAFARRLKADAVVLVMEAWFLDEPKGFTECDRAQMEVLGIAEHADRHEGLIVQVESWEWSAQRCDEIVRGDGGEIAEIKTGEFEVVELEGRLARFLPREAREVM